MSVGSYNKYFEDPWSWCQNGLKSAVVADVDERSLRNTCDLIIHCYGRNETSEDC